MRHLEVEHEDIYREFEQGKFVVKTSKGNFKAVSPDMKLEQTIYRSQKTASGIVGQTKTDSYVCEWELVYHEILSISNCYSDLTKSNTRTGPAMHHELSGNISEEMNNAASKIANFILARGNPYEASVYVPLHNFTSGQLFEEDVKKRVLRYFDDGKERYEAFRKERLYEKSKLLSDTITNVNLPKLDQKPNKPKTATQIEKCTSKEVGFAKKRIDIARARGISMKEILTYDHFDSNLLFDEELLAKPNKSDLMKELENHLTSDDYNFQFATELNTATVVDFMSQIRRYPTKNLKTFGDLFEIASAEIMDKSGSKQFHIIYDSYLEESIKECERIRRRRKHEPLEFLNLNLSSPIPVQIERFWSSGKNKEQLQILSREYYIKRSPKENQSIVLSGYVNDDNGIQSCVEVVNGVVSCRSDMDSMIEEADCRLITHVANAAKSGNQRIIIYSNGTDVAVYLLHYMDHFKILNVSEIRLRYGSSSKTRYIPIHTLFFALSANIRTNLLKCHVITGCDVSSKIGTKSATLKNKPELYLSNLGESGHVSEDVFASVEKFLVNITQKNSICSTFDELRWSFYQQKSRSLKDLPPSSWSIKGYILRGHYAIRLYNNLLKSIEIDPLLFGWIKKNAVLFPNKHLRYFLDSMYVTCKCKTCSSRRCSCRSVDLQCTENCKCGDTCLNNDEV